MKTFLLSALLLFTFFIVESFFGKIAIIASLTIIFLSAKPSLFSEEAKRRVFTTSFQNSRPKVNWSKRSLLLSHEPTTPTNSSQLAFSPRLLSAVLQIFNFIERDFVSSWYDHISDNTSPLNALHHLLLSIVSEFSLHLQQHAHPPQFISSRLIPLLTLHVETWKCAHSEWIQKKRQKSYRQTPDKRGPLGDLDDYDSKEFQDWMVEWLKQKDCLHPALSSNTPDKGQRHLRPIIDKLLSFLGPPSEMKSRCLTLLGREILLCQVLHPLIELITDPAWINKLIDSLATDAIKEQQMMKEFRHVLEKHAKEEDSPTLFPYQVETMKTYKQFTSQIKSCQSLYEARQLRHHIIVEIKKRNTDIAGRDKGDIINGMKIKDLKRYIEKLINAKKRLEKKIEAFGGTSITKSESCSGTNNLVSSKSLNFSVLLADSIGMSYFSEYMEQLGKVNKLRFYVVCNQILKAATEYSESEVKCRDFIKLYNLYGVSLQNDIRQHLSPRTIKELDLLCKKIDGRNKEQIYLDTTDLLHIKSIQNDLYLSMEREDFPDFKETDVYRCFISESVDFQEEENHFGEYGITSFHRLDSNPEILVSDPNGSKSDQDEFDKGNKAGTRSCSLSDISDFDAWPHNSDAEAIQLQLQVNSSDENANPLDKAAAEILSDVESDNMPSTSQAAGVVANKLREILEAEEFKNKGTTFEMQNEQSQKLEENLDQRMNPLTTSDLNECSQGLISKPISQSFSQNQPVSPTSSPAPAPFTAHLAPPGDLLLSGKVECLKTDIERLTHQELILDMLISKAMKFNRDAELKILRKSKTNIRQELSEKMYQKEQYELQEAENVILPGRTVIHIPNFTTAQDESSPFVLYFVQVRQLSSNLDAFSSGWIVARRYSEFFELHSVLKSKYKELTADIPNKHVVSMSRYKQEFIENRRVGLEKYLQDLCKIKAVCESEEFKAFLCQQNVALPRKPKKFQSLMKHLSRIGLHAADESETQSISSVPQSPVAGISSAPKRMYQRESSSKNSILDFVTDQLNQTFLNPNQSQPEVSPSLDPQSRIHHSGSSTLLEGLREAILPFGWSDINISNDAEVGDISNDAERKEKYSNSEMNFRNTVDPPDMAPLSLIEPVCDFFIELFDLNEKSNWLRRQGIILILQQLLGGTVERILLDYLHYFLSEQQFLIYIKYVKASLWPEGKWYDSNEYKAKAKSSLDTSLTSVEREKDAILIKQRAERKLLYLIPELFSSIVGRSNAKKGALQLFRLFQNKTLNQHLCYRLLDEFVQFSFPAIFPKVSGNVPYKENGK